MSPELGSTRASVGLFCAFFLLVLALLAPATLRQPPVWDASTGLFPAAITLAENGFDLPDLLSRPGWAHGGPNIHPFSSVTWATALVLRAFPDRDVWLPLLHLLHYALAAATLLGLFRLARPGLPLPLALALAVVLLLWPLFQVQAGALYTEMPLAFCTVWAVHGLARERWVAAAVFSALACSVKEAGLVVPAALAVAALLAPGDPRKRAWRALLFVLPAAVFVALHLGIAIPIEERSGVRPLGYLAQLRDLAAKLALVPDLALLLLVFAGLGLAWLPAGWRALRMPSGADPRARVVALSLLVAGAFAGFYLVVPLTVVEVYVLPRYYVQLLPLVLLVLACSAVRWGGVRAAAALLAVLALFFVANRRGELPGLYPPVPGNELSLAERSLEYRDLLAAQRDLLAAAASLPEDLPVFYGLPEHFLFAWPRMGYTDGPPPRGHCVWLERHERRPRLADYPPRFAVLYNFVGYGGAHFQTLLREARRDPSRRVRSQAFERGRYRTFLVEVEPAGRS